MSSTRARIALAAVAVSLVAGGLTGPAASADPPSCPDTAACIWTATDFNGIRRILEPPGDPAGVIIYYNEWFRSAKNRFNNRKLRIGIYGFYFDQIACLNPGGTRPSPGRFNAVIIGDIGSRCS